MKQGTPKQEARTFLLFLASWRVSQFKCRMDLAKRKGAFWSSPGAKASGGGRQAGKDKGRESGDLQILF